MIRLIALFVIVACTTAYSTDTIKAGNSTIDSLQAQVDSIFEAEQVGAQIDSAAVHTISSLAQEYRKIGQVNKFWMYRNTAIRAERLSDKTLPDVHVPVIQYKRMKLDI